MVVMGLLLTASLGTLEFIDRSQSRSGPERIRETAFNVSEALLNQEVLRLNRKWPSRQGRLACDVHHLGHRLPGPSQASTASRA